MSEPVVRELHVGVNLLWLVPGVVGGSEEYTIGLLRALALDAPSGVRTTVFALEGLLDSYPDLAEALEVVTLALRGRSKALRVAAEATWLRWQCRRRGIDLVHHAGGTVPILARGRSVVTVHDLQPMLMPEHFSATKRAYLHWRLAPSVSHAARVLTLTRYTAATITEHLGVSPARITLVPPGVAPPACLVPEDDPRTRYQLDGPFFLYPAITYPHKNHRVLIEGFASLAERHPDALLVLSHRPAQEESSLAALILRLGIAHRVRRVGRVPEADLDWLYRAAVALTFPSRFEGFGMPVLEAMARGCPVLAADATALPEVVGTAGVLLDPDRPEAWSRAMTELLADDGRRAELRAAGLARAATYTWSSSVARLVEAYRAAMAGPIGEAVGS